MVYIGYIRDKEIVVRRKDICTTKILVEMFPEILKFTVDLTSVETGSLFHAL